MTVANDSCVYFEQGAGGVKLRTTAHLDRVVARLNRSSRRASKSSPVIAAVVVNKDGARKLRRVVDRAWAGQRRGGGVFTVAPADVRLVVHHLADKFGMTVYGTDRQLSEAANNIALQHFARGRKAKWTPPAGQHDGAIYELLAAGAITKHRGGIYRGSERTAAMARRTASGHVPKRGKPPVVVSNAPIIGEAVVPEPHMARELLLARMDEATDAGKDPHDVLHRDAYRGALVNLRDQLGGFAALDLDELQRRGVAKFRQTGEGGQLGGAKAVDYEVTKVDSSLINSVTEAGALARAEHEAAREMLKAPRRGEDEDDRRPGLVRVAIAERMIMHGHSLRQVAVALSVGTSGAARRKVRAIAIAVATDLATHYGFQRGRRASTKFDGDRPTGVHQGFRVEIGAKSR